MAKRLWFVVATRGVAHFANPRDLTLATWCAGGRNESVFQPDPPGRIFNVEPWDNDDAIDAEDERCAFVG
jgi:hypothetical protein